MSSKRSDVGSRSDAREGILKKLEDGIDHLSQAIEAADPTTPAEKQLQLRRYHELGYLANQYRKLEREMSLEEMDQRLTLLEAERDD